MGKKKIAVIGAGQVGGTTAELLALKELGDVVLVDIIEGFPQGKALDLAHMGPVYGYDTQIRGTNSYEDIKDSDIVVVTSGIPRKPGMSRDDLVTTNGNIIKEVTSNIVKYAPNAIIIMVTNPLDAMTFLAYKTSGFPKNRIIGMAGILDSSRFRAFLSMELNVSVKAINAFVLGSHGDTMVPSVTYTTVGGVPVKDLVPKERLDEIVKRTRKAGGEIVSLLKTGSAFYAPAAGITQMVESILHDKKELLPCCALCEGEYGIKDSFMGVPVLLGANGLEKIVEFKLSTEEEADLKRSAEAIKKTCEELYRLKLL
jgi:malate dehydrogenase